MEEQLQKNKTGMLFRCIYVTIKLIKRISLKKGGKYEKKR